MCKQSTADSPFDIEYAKKATQVFTNPRATYPWDDVIDRGIMVRTSSGKTKRMWAVAPNTFRGFHRINKWCPGAQEAFRDYFVENKYQVLELLGSASCATELDEAADHLCCEIRPRLTNIKEDMLRSYNKLRKPIDLFLEHLVSMARELDSQRLRLVPMLFLPIDSQIMEHPAIFTDRQLASHGLTRRSTYKDVGTRETYAELQQLVQARAESLTASLRLPFHSIYFDLAWNSRYSADGGNLFETNPE